MKNYAHETITLFAPIVLNLVKEILPHLQNFSKGLINKSPNAFALNGTKIQHYLLYLHPKKYYDKVNQELAEIVIEELRKLTPEDIKLALEGKTQEQIEQDAINAFDELTDLGAKALNDKEVLSNPDAAEVAEIFFARFFDILSVIEHKRRICDLLIEALDNQDKYLNIAKAARIDPTVNRIPEIKDYIDQLPLEKQSRLFLREANEIPKPILDSKKNRISVLPMVYIGLVDLIGFTDGVNALSISEHRAIADDLGVLEELEDITYFDKLFRNYLKSKVKEST